MGREEEKFPFNNETESSKLTFSSVVRFEGFSFGSWSFNLRRIFQQVSSVDILNKTEKSFPFSSPHRLRISQNVNHGAVKVIKSF